MNVPGNYLGGTLKIKEGSAVRLIIGSSSITVITGLNTTVPLTRVVSADVDAPDQVRKRVTATRLVALGPLALAAKKKVKLAYLTVETADHQALFEVKAEPMKVRGALMSLRRAD